MQNQTSNMFENSLFRASILLFSSRIPHMSFLHNTMDVCRTLKHIYYKEKLYLFDLFRITIHWDACIARFTELNRLFCLSRIINLLLWWSSSYASHSCHLTIHFRSFDLCLWYKIDRFYEYKHTTCSLIGAMGMHLTIGCLIGAMGMHQAHSETTLF